MSAGTVQSSPVAVLAVTVLVWPEPVNVVSAVAAGSPYFALTRARYCAGVSFAFRLTWVRTDWSAEAKK